MVHVIEKEEGGGVGGKMRAGGGRAGSVAVLGGVL